MSIKYRYALDSNNNIVDIHNLTKGTRDGYYSCISCETELIPKLGKTLVKHFSHKNLQPCSNESYLHKLGKKTLYNTYTKCLRENLPFYIEYTAKHTCTKFSELFPELNCFEEKKELFDLTKVFDLVSIEGRLLNFSADILLESSSHPKKKLMLEIAVTHSCSDEKISSNIPIIELRLKNENSIQWLYKTNISKVLKKIPGNTYNFKKVQKRYARCSDRCLTNKEQFVFLVRKDGTHISGSLPIHKITSLINQETFSLTHFFNKPIPPEIIQRIKQVTTEADGQNIVLKNCHHCHHFKQLHGKRTVANLCTYEKEYNKHIITSLEAETCNFYKPSSK